MEEKVIKTKFVDECGENEVVIESSDSYRLNMDNKSYKIANGMIPKNKKFKNANPFTSDIGIKSGGFAQVATLAGIIALGGIVVAYLLFRF